MSLRLALPGNRYSTATNQLLERLDAEPCDLPALRRFSIRSMTVTAFITKPRDTAGLLFQSVVDLAVVPDEWLLEYSITANALANRHGSIPWIDARLSLFCQQNHPWTLSSPPSVVTPFPGLVKQRCKLKDVPLSNIVCVLGTTEAFVPAVADLGCDVVETGTTLRRYNLVEQVALCSNLQLSLVSRAEEYSRGLQACVDRLLGEAHEAGIAGPN